MPHTRLANDTPTLRAEKSHHDISSFIRPTDDPPTPRVEKSHHDIGSFTRPTDDPPTRRAEKRYYPTIRKLVIAQVKHNSKSRRTVARSHEQVSRRYDQPHRRQVLGATGSVIQHTSTATSSRRPLAVRISKFKVASLKKRRRLSEGKCQPRNRYRTGTITPRQPVLTTNSAVDGELSSDTGYDGESSSDTDIRVNLALKPIPRDKSSKLLSNGKSDRQMLLNDISNTAIGTSRYQGTSSLAESGKRSNVDTTRRNGQSDKHKEFDWNRYMGHLPAATRGNLYQLWTKPQSDLGYLYLHELDMTNFFSEYASEFVLIKVGHATDPRRRHAQWKASCEAMKGSVTKELYPAAHEPIKEHQLLEDLVLEELRAISRPFSEKCPACGVMHRELFFFERKEHWEGIIEEVVLRWASAIMDK